MSQIQNTDGEKTVRTRFAPSPTGYVHIGSLRTALFSFLLARHTQGVNILRVEDTDQNRLVQGALENLVKVMHKMGVEFDEGYSWDEGSQKVKERGEYGPYLQSSRLEIYQKHIEELLANKHAYYCYCSTERLDELRKEQSALKKPPMYDRLCRNLDEDARAEALRLCLSEGRKPVVRMAIPLSGQTKFEDLIYGPIVYENRVLDDQVILKADGFPTYHLAVVVDDHYMHITHVIRGEEWLPSTPKHILLYQAFGWEPTLFAHLPLILNPDKSKLSKRQGDVAVEDFLKKGYLKEALINFVAFLGWNPKTEQEIFSIGELIEQFDLTKVNKSGAVFDSNKLDWFNGHYIRNMDSKALVVQLKPFWPKSRDVSLSTDKELDEYLERIVDIEKDRLKKLSEIDDRTGFYFTPPELDRASIVWKKSDITTTILHLEGALALIADAPEAVLSDAVKLQELFETYIADKQTDKGTVLWPVRYALSGLPASPGPFELITTLFFGLGKREVLSRLQNAIEVLRS